MHHPEGTRGLWGLAFGWLDNCVPITERMGATVVSPKRAKFRAKPSSASWEFIQRSTSVMVTVPSLLQSWCARDPRQPQHNIHIHDESQRQNSTNTDQTKSKLKAPSNWQHAPAG